jgi:hypothetical protein
VRSLVVTVPGRERAMSPECPVAGKVALLT